MGDTVLERKASTFETAQAWTKKRVLEPVEKAIKVLTGQAAHDEIKKFILENEAVSDALYTRLLEAETRIQSLTTWVRGLAVAVVILLVIEIAHLVLR